MRYLLLLLTLGACGDIRVAHDHSGEVVHTIVIDQESLNNYFDYICDFDPECKQLEMSIFNSFMVQQ